MNVIAIGRGMEGRDKVKLKKGENFSNRSRNFYLFGEEIYIGDEE